MALRYSLTHASTKVRYGSGADNRLRVGSGLCCHRWDGHPHDEGLWYQPTCMKARPIQFESLSGGWAAL